MPKQVRLRRGTTVQHATFTGADGEVTYDSTKKAMVVHDGVTAGGKPVDGFLKLSPGTALTPQSVNGLVYFIGGDGDSDTIIVNGVANFQILSASSYVFAKRLWMNQATLVYAAATVLNFNTYGSFTMPLTGNISFSTSGVANGKILTARFVCDGTLRTLTWPAFTWVGGVAPINLAANKSALLTLTCFGVTDADVLAQWAVQS